LAIEWNVPPPDGVGRRRAHCGNGTGAAEHLLGRAAREREKEDPARVDPLMQEMGHAVGKGPRLPAARAGNDKKRAVPERYCRSLLVIEIIKPRQGSRLLHHPKTSQDRKLPFA